MTPSEKKEAARRELARAQAQLEAATERTLVFRALFRDERDEAIKKAVEAKVSTAEVATIVHSTPQWVNKILRGEAYGRRTD